MGLRIENAVGKPLGPEWKILLWHRVAIYTISGPRREHDFIFASQELAIEFAEKAKKKYPHRAVVNVPACVLTSNDGKTAYLLSTSGIGPRKSSVVPDFFD